MNQHTITGVKRTDKGDLTHLVLETGSVITEGDLIAFIKSGVRFVTKDDDGNMSNLAVVESRGSRHLRTVRNSQGTDNLGKLPQV